MFLTLAAEQRLFDSKILSNITDIKTGKSFDLTSTIVLMKTILK